MKLALRGSEVELSQKPVLEFLSALTKGMAGHLRPIETQLFIKDIGGIPAFGDGESFREERVDPPPCTARSSRSWGVPIKSLVAEWSLVASLR